MHINFSWLSSVGSFLRVATVTVVAISQVTTAIAQETHDFSQRDNIAVKQMVETNEGGSRVSIDREGNTDRSLLPHLQNISECPEGLPRPCSPDGSR